MLCFKKRDELETGSENNGSRPPKLSSTGSFRYAGTKIKIHTHLRMSGSKMGFQLRPAGQGHVTDCAGMPRSSMLTGYVLLQIFGGFCPEGAGGAAVDFSTVHQPAVGHQVVLESGLKVLMKITTEMDY
jgi:hypothetical protein